MKETGRQRLQAAVKAALPICVGYLPLGFACGVALQNAGLTPFSVTLMSVFVYAGGGQFVTASMLTLGAGAFSLISTIFMVNIRHLLFSWTLSPFLAGKNGRFLIPFAHEITDESFAVNYIQFRKGDWRPSQAITVNITAHLTWIIATTLGAVVGSIIHIDVYLVNFVLTSMFICLFCMQLENKLYVAVGVLAAVVAVVLKGLFGGNVYIILTAVIAATFGYFMEKRISLKKEENAVGQ